MSAVEINREHLLKSEVLKIGQSELASELVKLIQCKKSQIKSQKRTKQ